jgi:hypothetical protein
MPIEKDQLEPDQEQLRDDARGSEDEYSDQTLSESNDSDSESGKV